MIKQLIKRVLHTVVPMRYDSLMAARENRHGQFIMAKHGVPAIAVAIVEKFGDRVLTGPFAGMSYITESAGSSFVPKLLGIYESELNSVFNRIIASDYTTVADVGSAEGFYAVGLALRMSGSQNIYAFDINPEARRLCHSLAKQNGVDKKIIICGHCDAEHLQKTLNGRSLVICDCEGYEIELLQPKIAPALANADILVELHDCLKPGITSIIMERFAETHDIMIIDSTDRNPADYPVVDFLESEQQKVAVSEFRHGPQQWAFMTPKTDNLAPV